MRPRPDAAENYGGVAKMAYRFSTCFNEAAARCRGKQNNHSRENNQ